jgi:hypothetical protein
MSKPLDANWYGGGFFDLKLNGQTVGTRMAHVFAGRATGDRGYVDYVFDTAEAVVRVRFVGLAGGDCLYAQVLLEPKVELTSVSADLRCYPAGFINGPTRRALTPTRELPNGPRLTLAAEEYWLNYHDSSRTENPCAALWVPEQVQEATVSVGVYSIDTTLQLKPALRDLRFIFFDHTGQSNAEAQAGLKERAPQLLEELKTLVFTDAALLNWSLADKQADTRALLAALPEDKERAARYAQWHRELDEQLKQVRDGGGAGAILAEARALKTIMEWDQSLPNLRLEALLNSL